MTTTVTVKASGPCYPARAVKWEPSIQPPGELISVEDVMIPSGFSCDFHLGQHQTLTVTEEYYPEGYPAK